MDGRSNQISRRSPPTLTSFSRDKIHPCKKFSSYYTKLAQLRDFGHDTSRDYYRRDSEQKQFYVSLGMQHAEFGCLIWVGVSSVAVFGFACVSLHLLLYQGAPSSRTRIVSVTNFLMAPGESLSPPHLQESGTEVSPTAGYAFEFSQERNF